MGNKIKQWRQSRRKDEEDTIDEEELLYLQGLVRCQSCEIPYPNYLENCPHCKAKSIYHYMLNYDL